MSSCPKNPCSQTIVCPLLCENCLSSVLRYAGFLAKCCGARLLVTNVVAGAAGSEEDAGLSSGRDLDSLPVRPYRQLDGLQYERFELTGDPVAGIAQFVKEVQADLVVLGNDVGNEGKPALGQLTLRIMNHLPCTVVVVKDQVNSTRSAQAGDATPNAISPNGVT